MGLVIGRGKVQVGAYEHWFIALAIGGKLLVGNR